MNDHKKAMIPFMPSYPLITFMMERIGERCDVNTAVMIVIDDQSLYPNTLERSAIKAICTDLTLKNESAI